MVGCASTIVPLTRITRKETTGKHKNFTILTRLTEDKKSQQDYLSFLVKEENNTRINESKCLQKKCFNNEKNNKIAGILADIFLLFISLPVSIQNVSEV